MCNERMLVRRIKLILWGRNFIGSTNNYITNTVSPLLYLRLTNQPKTDPRRLHLAHKGFQVQMCPDISKNVHSDLVCEDSHC